MCIRDRHWNYKAVFEESSTHVGILLQIQSGYDCCGFSRPQMCRVNRTFAPPTTELYKSTVLDPKSCGQYENDNGVFQPVERWFVRCVRARARAR